MSGFSWPKNYKCAVVLSFDVDAELFWNVWLPSKPKLFDIAQGTYGPRVALPRLLKVLERQGVKATFFTPGWVIEKYTDNLREVVKKGHEIAYHGYLHENTDNLSLEEERAAIQRGSDCIKSITGKHPVGHRMGRSANTLKLLQEFGFIYDSGFPDDDVPYRIDVDGKKTDLVELPVSLAFNDSMYFAQSFDVPARVIKTPDEVYKMYCREFDQLYSEGRYCMFMLHPQLIGRPGRAAMLERTIKYMKSKGVWFATAEQVAQHAQKVLG